MKVKVLFASLIFIMLVSSCSSLKQTVGPQGTEKWRALHVLNFNDDTALDSLGMVIPTLASRGINVIFLEVDYSFDYKSHPELRRGKDFITKVGASKISQICRDNNIKLIIQFQSFGHQSWAKETFPLLTQYPHLDLTQGAYPNNENIYCREWDPTNPQVYEIVYALLDELIDAFETDGIHVGMDEVFLISDSNAVSTRDKNPAEVYAKVVNDMYDHIVKKRGLEMYMWGDRLIDANKYPYGIWEASANGTAPAIDMIPKDIIICDWHYELMDEYPSIPMFLEKGFRVLPTGWRNVDATKSLINYARKHDNPKMLGHLFSIWSGGLKRIMEFEAMKEGLKVLQSNN